jgi:large exoprotein involved in heme utilization and adhesion
LFEVTSNTSGLLARTLGAGAAGNLTISTPKLTVRDGAAVATDTRGDGRGGNLTVNAPDSVEVIGFNSFLSTNSSDGAGAAGNLTIKTGKLLVRDVALISADGFNGPGGRLEVTAAESVKLIDVGILSALSGIEVPASLTITTGKLLVQNGSALTTFSFDTNKIGAGNITVTARESVELSRTPNSQFGAGGISALTNSDEAAGNVTISTGKLTIQDGGQVTTQTFGGDRGGNITVTASESVELIGTSADGKSSSGLFTTNSTDLGGIPQATGAAGDLTIATGKLIVRDGAEVNVSSEALGNAGSLRVQADSIFIDNQGKLQASTASQEGGNINLRVRDLILMRDQGLISAKAENNGNGGNVTINAPFIVAVPGENSDIIANAFQGRGGNINITTQGIYGLEYRPQLTPNSDINASSQFGVNGTVQINTPGIDPSRGLANLPTEVVDASNQIDQTCSAGGREARKNEFIVTGRRGMPSNPYEPLSNEQALEDIQPPSGFSSNRNSKPVAARTVTSQSATSNPKPPIAEAQGWEANDKGQLVLTATASTATPHNSLPASATCPSS